MSALATVAGNSINDIWQSVDVILEDVSVTET